MLPLGDKSKRLHPHPLHLPPTSFTPSPGSRHSPSKSPTQPSGCWSQFSWDPPGTHLEGLQGRGSRGRRHEPCSDLLHQVRPRRAPPGSKLASRKDSLGRHTGRSPGLHLPGSRRPGTGARLQRPPAPGGGQGPCSRPQRGGQGESRWCQRLGAHTSLNQAGQASPGAATLGGVCELSPACGKPSPCSPPVLCTGPTRSYSCSLCWLGKYASAEFWWPWPPGWGAKAPAWPGASWKLNTATGLSPPPSRFPDNRRGGRSHHSDGRPHGYP